MKRNRRNQLLNRGLSLCLALVMLVGMMPINVFATEEASETRSTEPTVATEATETTEPSNSEEDVENIHEHGYDDGVCTGCGAVQPAPEWEVGTIAYANGLDWDSTTRLRTVAYLKLFDYAAVRIGNGYELVRFVYDENHTMLSGTDWLGSGVGFSVEELRSQYPNGMYFRVAVRASNDRTLTINDLTASCITFYTSSEDVPEQEIGWNQKEVMKVTANQDGAVYNGKVFCFNGSGTCTVYSLDDKNCLGSFTLDNISALNPHANSVCFGNTFYVPGDLYPLLYVNVYNNYSSAADRMEGTCCVYRLTELNGQYSTELVQVIRIGFTEDLSLWKSKKNNGNIRPYGNFVVDTDKDELYAFVMRDADNTTRFFRFRLPDLNAGVYSAAYGCNVVTLEISDILSWFDTNYITYMQGCCYGDGKILSVEGFSSGTLRIIDLETQSEVRTEYLADRGLTSEPELICLENGTLYYAGTDGTLRVLSLDGMHFHDYTASTTAPTCTEQGYTTYTCACGASFVDSYVDAKGHNYGGKFVCSECGYEAKVSVLGDSISTYSGISGVKNAVYPNSTVKSVSDTWWKQVIDVLGGEVLKINASGGSRILSDEHFNGAGIRDGNHAAYRDRCVNLHVGNDTPDVILVFMGTNDFSYHVESECESCQILLTCTECTSRADGNLNVCAACRAASGVYSSFCNLPLGTADSVDLSRETPTSSCEAYAIMLSKMKAAYPDVRIYCLSLLPRVNPYQSVVYHDHGQPNVFNAELKKVAENAGATFIDLEQCLDNSAATWSTYFGDAVHPTATGMDKISEAVISGVLGNEVYMVSSEVTDGVTLSGKSWAIAGNTYEASIVTEDNGLQLNIRVTMNGTDITETAFDAQTGKISIDNVTGNIVITIKAKVAEEKITWSVGAVNSSNGSLADMSSRIRTNMFAVTRGALITAANGAEFCPVFYDKDGNFVFSPNAYDSDGVLEIPAGQYVYMRLMARNSKNTNETMTPAYGENITVTFGSETAG